jgi:molybdenum ABC transporter molybdate-binding protein
MQWPGDWSVGVRVWVERKGHAVLDEAAADVLMALERTKSISAAARSLGISYRHAWVLVEEASKRAGKPLVETAIGGKRGGGAELTEYGRAAVAAFQQIRDQVRSAAAKAVPHIVAPGAKKSAVVHVAAAISLQEVIAQVLNEFALVRPTVAVRTIFGSSNELADQIAAGSSADIFISASESHISRLVKAGVIDRRSRRKLASNGLAIIGDAKFAGKIKKPADLRKLSDVPVVVADPACPLGACTEEFLTSADLLEELVPRIKYVDNSRAVVHSLRASRPRLGIVFGSDATNANGLATLAQIPDSEASTVYQGGLIATSNVREDAESLLDFLTTDTAKTCFRRCGFTC